MKVLFIVDSKISELTDSDLLGNFWVDNCRKYQYLVKNHYDVSFLDNWKPEKGYMVNLPAVTNLDKITSLVGQNLHDTTHFTLHSKIFMSETWFRKFVFVHTEKCTPEYSRVFCDGEGKLFTKLDAKVSRILTNGKSGTCVASTSKVFYSVVVDHEDLVHISKFEIRRSKLKDHLYIYPKKIEDASGIYSNKNVFELEPQLKFHVSRADILKKRSQEKEMNFR